MSDPVQERYADLVWEVRRRRGLHGGVLFFVENPQPFIEKMERQLGLEPGEPVPAS